MSDYRPPLTGMLDSLLLRQRHRVNEHNTGFIYTKIDLLSSLEERVREGEDEEVSGS